MTEVDLYVRVEYYTRSGQLVWSDEYNRSVYCDDGGTASETLRAIADIVAPHKSISTLHRRGWVSWL